MKKILVVDDTPTLAKAIDRAMSKSAAKAQPKPLNDGVKCPACDGEGKVAILHDENSYNTCGICEGKGTLTKEGLDGYKAFFKEGI